jgi:hypothetical protein
MLGDENLGKSHTGDSGLAASLDTDFTSFRDCLLQRSNTMDRVDPYVVLLRRELTRAQARLRRCERERDALRDALEALKTKRPPSKSKKRVYVSK